MTSVLRAEGLSKRFGGLKAVDDVSLHLQEGEILGLIGPNGAGKSTLFSMLAGSIPPSGGRFFLGERELTSQPAFRVARAGVIRTHQIVRPFAMLTVIENATVAAVSCGRDPSLARKALEFAGLSDRRHEYPHHLTLAGRKRLEMARALAAAPRVLLLDEVIAGVSPKEAEDMARLVRRARDEMGVSIVMTEHVMPAVMSLANRIVVLDAGKLIAEGSPAEIVRNPSVVAAYLGKAHAT
jgi:branched-chain amino acid transport system ATP-binding protein